MPSTRNARPPARRTNARSRTRRIATTTPTRVIRHIHVQPRGKPFSVSVKQLHNKALGRSWVQMEFTDNRTGQSRQYKVSTKTYNAWVTQYRKKGGKGSMLTAMGAQMAAHPDAVKAVFQHGHQIATSGIGEVFKLMFDAM